MHAELTRNEQQQKINKAPVCTPASKLPNKKTQLHYARLISRFSSAPERSAAGIPAAGYRALFIRHLLHINSLLGSILAA